MARGPISCPLIRWAQSGLRSRRVSPTEIAVVALCGESRGKS
jgi:hypothetical protein